MWVGQDPQTGTDYCSVFLTLSQGCSATLFFPMPVGRSLLPNQNTENMFIVLDTQGCKLSSAIPFISMIT